MAIFRWFFKVLVAPLVTTLISGAISISMEAVASRANLMKPAAVDNFDAELVDAVA